MVTKSVYVVVISLAFALFGASHQASAQAADGGDSAADSESNATNNSANQASVNTGNNVFDFSGATSAPNAPGLPSFAGGPCLGTSVSMGGSLPGFGISGGKSTEDEACQRRSWVQTLIGASQNMGPEDAAIMRRLAFEVMREDKYLAGPFERIGFGSVETSKPRGIPIFRGSPREEDEVSGTSTSQPAQTEKKPKVLRASRVGRQADGCVAVVAEDSPQLVVDMLTKRGCAIEMRELPGT
jgi:hypothetical protein